MSLTRGWSVGVVFPIVLIGVLLSLGVFRLASGWETDRAEVVFGDLAEAEVARVQRRLSVCLEQLFALRSFFHGSESVSDAEFVSFASELRERHPILQALEWIPTVDTSSREEHERAAQAAGLDGYRIRELDGEGVFVPANGRDRYYPVRYLDPVLGQKIALGFDLGSEPVRRATLLRSSRELRPVISDPLILVQGSRGVASFIASLPMERFAGDAPPDYARGSYLLAVISLGNEHILPGRKESPAFSEIRLLVRNDTANTVVLNWKNPRDGIEPHPGIQHVREIELGARTWRIESRPSTEFISNARTTLPAALSAGTLGVWFALIGGGLMLSRLARERSRRRHTRILDSVLASVDEGIVVADSAGHILLVNEAARRYVGRIDHSLSVSQWPARVGAYLPDAETLYGPAELPIVRAMRGETVRATEVYVRNPAIPKGAWVTVTGKPLIDETGEHTGGVIVIRDHTGEKEVQATMDRLSQAVEVTGDAVFITSKDGAIEYVNEAFVQTTGYTREEVVGRNPRILKSGKHGEDFYTKMWSTLLNGEVHRTTVVNRRKSGQVFTAEETIAPMRDAAGRVTHFVAVMKDMTETLRRREQEVELRLAAQVQQRLYPQEPPCVAGWDFAGLVLPAEATCGDYYDFMQMGNGHVGLAIGDVCGHGLGPALVMSEVRALLRSGAAETSDAAELLRRANSTLTADLEDDNFVTLMMATVETNTRRMEWVNAGHPSAYVLAADGSLKAELASQTVPLGILPDLGIDHAEGIELDRGDLILLVTDGVTERGDGDARCFGPEGALAVLRELRDRPAAEIARGVVDAVRDFSDEPQADDVTLIVVRVG